MIILYMIIYIISLMFIQMIHPLSAGFLIMMQTLLICLILGIQSINFWYSYILFLIFLGGLLVLFIYISSLAQNEMFLPNKMWWSKLMLNLLIAMMILYFMKLKFMQSFDSLEFSSLFSNKYDNTITYFYSFNLMKITMFLGVYLLICLIAVSVICQIIKGPLRQKF